MDPHSDPSATGTGGAVATQLRVAVADDDTLLREGLASLLVGSGFEIVGPLMLNGLVTAVGINLLQSRLERWDYDRHFQD